MVRSCHQRSSEVTRVLGGHQGGVRRSFGVQWARLLMYFGDHLADAWSCKQEAGTVLELSWAEFVMTRFLFGFCLAWSFLGLWARGLSVAVGGKKCLELTMCFAISRAFQENIWLEKGYYCVFFEFCKVIGGNFQYTARCEVWKCVNMSHILHAPMTCVTNLGTLPLFKSGQKFPKSATLP